MASYRINKGVNAQLDFFGLKSQYIIYFMVGMVLAFVVFFALQFISKVLAFVGGGAIGLLVYFICHWANKKLGQHGPSVQMAKKMLPNRVAIKRARDIVKL